MINYTTNAQKAFLMDRLKGEFCYVQTRNGKIVSIHYSPTEDEEAVNIKRGIAGAFQANFDHREKAKESDPGSTHISHYRYVYKLLELLLTIHFTFAVMQRHLVRLFHLLEAFKKVI